MIWHMGSNWHLSGLNAVITGI